jgi:hypothetical protein
VPVPDHQLEALDRIRRLPFVEELHYAPAHDGPDLGYDGKIEIQTTAGPFHLLVEAKRSYLTRPAVSQLLAWLSHMRTDQTPGVILLARHISRQAAEVLIESNVNFADDSGNIHLELGDAYNWTVIGIPAPEPISKRRAISPAQLQLLFEFVTSPDSINWPVRRLEPAAGVSKSRAAQARRQMIAEGFLIRAGKKYHLGPANLLADRLVSGYVQVLRPKLSLGSFRPAEKTVDAFLGRLSESGVKYSLSGGPAAELLQHFYRGPDVTLFLKPSTREVVQQLRLLPDRDGPVTILKAFGDVVFWQERQNQMLAPPWLIYAELLSGKDPRAHEAAGEFRREFLS